MDGAPKIELAAPLLGPIAPRDAGPHGFGEATCQRVRIGHLVWVGDVPEILVAERLGGRGLVGLRRPVAGLGTLVRRALDPVGRPRSVAGGLLDRLGGQQR